MTIKKVQYCVDNSGKPQKAMVQELIDPIAGKNVYLPHKLYIRCRLLPHTKLLHGIRREK